MHDDLEQEIAEFLGEMCIILVINGFNDLISLFDETVF